ncbi:hypothetical protein D9619_013376 [Psilocybe cf. subviscida]|uniref:Tc1-like transposase DDE domain-containing protein n=1 Tax=Psilocybe cf. subviscida TaxID=2480587 RepID=A0A8H5F9A5_9AGAR|nr:hypothetical protein D9619_013376 [Psilocybe cf. subviscida]
MMYPPKVPSLSALRYRYKKATRAQVLTLGCILTFLLFAFIHTVFGFTVDRTFFNVGKDPKDPKSLPPTYKHLRELERTLPQHNLSLPYPEGKTGRYVLFKNQIQMLGWNNVFNELLFNTWLAYSSGRAYVFQDYIWMVEYYPWSREQFTQIFGDAVPRTPLSALISGPSAGGPWGPGDPAPRSVTEAWFDVVCPKESRRIINTRDVKPPIAWADGKVIFERWQQLLRDAPEGCIEIQPATAEEDRFSQTFDLWLVGAERVLSLWEGFRDSPVSKLLGASDIVKGAVEKNEHLFMPPGDVGKEGRSRDPFDHVMAMHIRRGDYARACMDLAKYNSTFYLWNQLPFLPDKFVGPIGKPSDTPENIAVVLDRCFPTTGALVERVHRAREDYKRSTGAGGYQMDTAFILTNDKTPWLQEFKTALLNDGWKHVVTTSDLVLDEPEEIDVGMTVDMEIGRRTAVFIGNGHTLLYQMPSIRTSRREHSPTTKSRLIGRVLAHQTITEAAAAENIPYDTATKIVRRHRNTGNTENLPRSGRPPKTTPREERHILQNAKNHRRKPLQELANESASNISATTVRRVLHRHNYHRCVAVTKPLLREHQISARLAWAKYRKDHGVIDFETTIYSDECYICLDDKHQCVFVTRLPEEKFLKCCTVPTFKQSSIRVMVWGCVISGRKGPLVILDYPGGRGGGMTAVRYKEQVLECALLGFYKEMKRERYLVDFQQDGASCHHAKLSLRWFQAAGISLVDHPPNSPDLNPIEPIWHDLKTLVRSLGPISTLNGLKSAVRRAWELLPVEKVDKQISLMPARVAAVLEAKGEHTQF